MNDDLFAAPAEYAKWYMERFGNCNPEWFVFPFGKPPPSDPTRYQTSLKTAWRNVRARANVKGRFHDSRHDFVTDLAEGGTSDQVIQELAGYVSMQMAKHYSHVRTEAKRQAVSALASRPVETTAKAGPTGNLETVLQNSLQVARPN